MSTPPGASPEEPSPWPSLDVVRAELDLEQQSYERRSASVDTKAGLLLAAAGAFIALRSAQPTLLQVIDQGVAAVAGLCAVWAFLPRVAGTISPLALRNGYLVNREHVTKLAVLDTRIGLLADDQRQLKRKVQRLLAAVILLAAAVAIALAGSIVTYVHEGGHDGEHGSSQPHSTSSASARSSAVQP